MIRKATQGEFDFIFDLHMHPQVNRFLFYEMMSATEFKSIYDRLLQQDNLYVYEEDGTLKGMFKPAPQQHRASHIAVLKGVAVHPFFSGRGCGQRMLNQIILLGKESGFLRLELGVSAINTKAVHLYEKAGFKKEGLLKKYIFLQCYPNFFLEWRYSMLKVLILLDWVINF